MLRTAVLQSSKRALALSVHFKHPDFGMKDYEILTRGSAFLLAVDPPEPISGGGKYEHLDRTRRERQERLERQDYAYASAGGPRRRVQDLGWLEFVPSDFRPMVHCVAASHVLAPWRWKDYYPHDWLQVVKQEHCIYSLEVYDTAKQEALAKFALSPYAIHHPEQLDVGIIHLKQEESALKHLKGLDVQVLNLRDPEHRFEKDEKVTFEGFEITEQEQTTDQTSIGQLSVAKKNESQDDTRIFVPFTETGNLIHASTDRFLAKTDRTLPEGLCGGPTLDENDRVAGIVEGIIPKDHTDKKAAGAASFIPSFRIQQFLEYAERLMLQTILPEELFSRVIEMKNTGELGAENMNPDYVQDEYRRYVDNLRKNHPTEEFDAIMGTIRREREEVLEIMNREGGELADVIAQVREKTLKTREELIKKYSVEDTGYEEERDDATDAKKS
jgi:hypothetical protein